MNSGYYMAPDSSLLTKTRATTNAPDETLRAMRHARISWIPEADNSKGNNTILSSTLNTLGGADSMSARATHGKKLETFIPQSTLFFSYNIPKELDRSQPGPISRIIVIPFVSEFREGVVDDDPARNIYKRIDLVTLHRELDRLAPEFMNMLLKDKFTTVVQPPPPAVVAATADYLKDPVQKWVDENLVISPGAWGLAFDRDLKRYAPSGMLPETWRQGLTMALGREGVQKRCRGTGKNVRGVFEGVVRKKIKVEIVSQSDSESGSEYDAETPEGVEEGDMEVKEEGGMEVKEGEMEVEGVEAEGEIEVEGVEGVEEGEMDVKHE